MKRFNRDEQFLIALYDTGTRSGLILELQKMRTQLTPSERWLRRVTDSTIGKLIEISDAEYERLDVFPK